MTNLSDKINYIESIANFDRATIDRLIEYSHDENLIVRYHAYYKLNSENLDPRILSERDWELLPKGILLNPGDIVWSVYQSGRTYTDDEFIIDDDTDYSGEHIYGREMTISSYDRSNRGVACKLISTHIDYESAEATAIQTVKQILSKEEYPYFSSYCADWHKKISQQDIYDWVKIYNIPDLPQPPNPEPFQWVDVVAENYNKWRCQKYREELYCYGDRLRSYAHKVIEKLTIDEHYEIIDKIYSNVVGRLAYVCKETVKETTYFKP
jgi:hypothetical protein